MSAGAQDGRMAIGYLIGPGPTLPDARAVNFDYTAYMVFLTTKSSPRMARAIWMKLDCLTS